MSNNGRKAQHSDHGRLMLEHVDRHGRVRLLPLTPQTQRLLAVEMLGTGTRQEALARQEPQPRSRSFTAREWQVLDFLVTGLSSKQIAHELQISPRTVEIYRANLMRKMGVRNTASLIRAAFLAA